MSDPNSSPLHKIADRIAGERPQPEPVDHVRAAVESFVQQKAHIDRLDAKLREQEITIARMDVELETRICDLNEARRERDHYFEYATRLVTQLNAADQLIRDALDMAREKRIEPAVFDIGNIDQRAIDAGFMQRTIEPLPPMPEPIAP